LPLDVPAISYFAELLALVIARPVGKFVKLGHRIGGREPRVLARENPVSAPRLTLSALRTGQQLRLLGGDDTLTKLAAAPRESAPLTLRARRCRISK